MVDIQLWVRNKWDLIAQSVTLMRLRGAAMVGTILLPVLVLVGAPAAGAFSTNSVGNGVGVGIFLVIVILIGVFSGVLAAILTVSIHILSEARTRLDYLELGLSLVGIMSFLVWLFEISGSFLTAIGTVGGIGLLYILIIARIVYHASPPSAS
jgi:hypothetical protein